MRWFPMLACLAALAAGAPLAAQLGLPGVPQIAVPPVGDLLGQVTRPVERKIEPVIKDAQERLDETSELAQDLARARLQAIERLVSSNRSAITRDAQGAPARAGEILVMDAAPAALALAAEAGFAPLSSGTIEGLGFAVTKLSLPEGMELAEAKRILALLMPGAVAAPDHLYFRSGSAGAVPLALAARGTVRETSGSVPVGMIDGAAGPSLPVARTKGFARGAPVPSNHGSAIASLLASVGAGPIYIADVYGTDPAGGNALAIAKGIGWLVQQGSRVISISLVGPKNPVLARAISAVRGNGVVVVAAVGNDGPAAPPAYPASYTNVIAVTAVDGRQRALIEAGRALHLDYAAPGADIHGRNAQGNWVELRGTSFAAPLVAGRIAHQLGEGNNWRRRLDRNAEDLGREGPDAVYGRGLVCGDCDGR